MVCPWVTRRVPTVEPALATTQSPDSRRSQLCGGPSPLHGRFSSDTGQLSRSRINMYNVASLCQRMFSAWVVAWGAGTGMLVQHLFSLYFTIQYKLAERNK